MKEAVVAFARAVGWGSLVGGAPFMILTIPIAFLVGGGPHTDDVPAALFIAISPLILAAVPTIAGALLIGLPLTAWLGARSRESVTIYSLAGLCGGIALPLVFAIATTGTGSEVWGVIALLAIPGMLAGTTTGTIWGQWRKRAAIAPAAPAEADQAAPTSKPDRGERWLR
jgi:hypothetical protein